MQDTENDLFFLRERFPEKIPFRLTRMLINALEVSGVEGSFRRTCEKMVTNVARHKIEMLEYQMQLLRTNKDAVMAMLEAFVFDPLITWRLMPTRRVNANIAVLHREDPQAFGKRHFKEACL